MKKRTLRRSLLKWQLMALMCTAAIGLNAQTTGTVYLCAGNATETQLYRLVDPGTPQVQAIPVGSPSAIPYQTIAYYNGDLYGTVSNTGVSTNGTGTGVPNIVKINPTTGVATFIPVTFPPPLSPDPNNPWLAYGNYQCCEVANGILYVQRFSAYPSTGPVRDLLSINLTTGAVHRIYINAGIADFVYYNGGLYSNGAGWASVPGASVQRIDPVTGIVTAGSPGQQFANSNWTFCCWKDGNNVMYFNKNGTFDPATGTLTSSTNTGSGFLTTPYGEFADGTWAPTSVTPTTYTISGNVYDDANGGTIDGTGTNAGGTLYVVLTNANGTIIGSSPVAANGTYSVSAPAGTYSAILTTSPTSTTPALPTGWVNTNEGLTTTGDGTVNGTIPAINVTGNVTAANFGLDQLPTAGSSTVTTGNPGGTGTINLTNNFTGTAGIDPDGTVSQIHFIGFPNNTTSITIGNTTYTASNWPATGVTVPVNTTVLLDPVDGTGTPVIPYKVIDNAGKESLNTGNVTVTITASGGTPDLTPTLVIDNLSFPVADVARDFIVNVFEINGAATTTGSTIKVRLAKLSGFTITYPTESGMSDVDGGIANENSNWTFTETSSFIFATAKPGVTIAASDVARLGFKISRKPGIINGTTQNLTTTIIAPSGGETNTVNNVAITSFTASSN